MIKQTISIALGVYLAAVVWHFTKPADEAPQIEIARETTR